MTTLIINERKVFLILFKDYTSYHNANTLSKEIKISRIGTMKILKNLLNENLLIAKNIGKSTVYKLNWKEDYVKSLITFLLADEANQFKRWKYEFKELFKKERIILLYGSAIKNYSQAKDIDIMIISDEKNNSEINNILNEKKKLLPKPLHSIKLTEKEMLENLAKKQVALVDIVKNAIVFSGQEKYVGVVQNVSSF